MIENVGTLIGLDETVVTSSSTFFSINNPQAGELTVENTNSQAALTGSEQGVYTCCIPDTFNITREINIGIYPSGFSSKSYFAKLLGATRMYMAILYDSFTSLKNCRESVIEGLIGASLNDPQT